MVETMNIDRILKQPDRLHVTNGHWITRYREKMGPVLIVTMHMGNWELGMWPVTLAGVRPAGVYRQVKNPYVDRYLRGQRKDLYPGGLFGRGRAPGQDETQKTARLIMDYVRQGGRLGFISDLYDAQGIAVPFFGHPAKSMPIAAMIARRVGARIWIGRCIRIGNRACFDVNVNELANSPHQQSGRGYPLDHRGDPASFRDLDPRDTRAIHVVKPALVLVSAPTAVDSILELRSYLEKT